MLLDSARFTLLLRRQIFRALYMDVGLLRGCALNGHEVLRGFEFWGDALNVTFYASLEECLFLGDLVRSWEYHRNSPDINQNHKIQANSSLFDLHIDF
jgi:hypothetical protein